MRVPPAKSSRSPRCSWLQSRSWPAVIVGLPAALLLGPASLYAVEPAEAFVKGLQDRGLYQQTLDYLAQMQSSQLVDDAFRERIPYFRGVTLLEQSRQTVDPNAQARLLQEAQVQLEQFTAANPGSVVAAEAQLQLATVLVEQGTRTLAQAGQLPAGTSFDAEREKRRAEARKTLESAGPQFQAAATTYEAELKKSSPAEEPNTDEGADEPDEGTSRQELRGRLAQVRVMAAQTQFELAQTHAPESPEFRQLHESVADELAKLYEEHSRWLVGFYARLYEGRCYQALEQYQLALGCYEDILAQPSVLPAFRPLMAKASRHRAECFLAQEKFEAAIESANAWLAGARPTEEKQPDWLAVRYQLAEALKQKGESLPADSLDQRKLFAAARDAYRLASAAPNEFQAEARIAAAALGRTDGDQKDTARTFQEAYERGKDALAAMNAAKMALPMAKNNNPTAVPDLEAQAEQGKADARRNFEAALSLRDDDIDLTQLNEIRYFLCWLSYDNQDYYRAAVLGEFLARRYPDHAAAASAAKLSMASFEQLYLAAAKAGAQGEDTDFEARQMAQMAEFITRRWPNTDDADAAFSVLVSYAIRNDRIDDAVKLLDRVSDESRPRLQLQLGNAMWGRYLEMSNQKESARPDDATLNQMKANAVRFLTEGYEIARAQPDINESIATAGLYLAQAHLSDSNYSGAIKLLEEPDGPLTLVVENHPAATRQAFAVEVYKAALRAYVSVTPPQGKKAVEIMDAMESALGTGQQSAEQLTRIYIGLGMTLEQHIDELRSVGRDAEAERVGAAFVEFLDRIAARQEGAGWAVRNWIAQTYLGLGTGQRDGTRTPSRGDGRPSSQQTDPTQPYLIKARDAYREMLDAAAADPSVAPSANAVLAGKLQLGQCYRELGEYKQALDMFSSILKEKETSVSVQQAAALTYQHRGEAENHRWFERAIYGGYKLKSTGKNRIWGWLKLAQVAERAARSNPDFRDAFFDARLNAARCRYLAGMKQEGPARKKDLARAKQSIRSMTQLYPDLGGDQWRGEYDALLKQIQKGAGEEQNGLQEFAVASKAS